MSNENEKIIEDIIEYGKNSGIDLVQVGDFISTPGASGLLKLQVKKAGYCDGHLLLNGDSAHFEVGWKGDHFEPWLFESAEVPLNDMKQMNEDIDYAHKVLCFLGFKKVKITFA